MRCQIDGPVRILITLALAIAGVTARAQDVSAHRIQVGDAIVDGRRLEPYENSWTMSVTSKDGKKNTDAGTWRDRFEIIEIAGKEYGLRIQNASFKNKSGEIAVMTKTTNVFERSTMAPVTREFERSHPGGIDEITRIDFSRRSVKVAKTKEAKVENRSFITERAFDFDGGLYALLWSALPLKEGFSATLPSYSEDDHPERVFWSKVKVTGSETTEAGSKGKIQCWVVEGDSESGPLKYWISSEPPYIIRMEFRQTTTGAFWVLSMP